MGPSWLRRPVVACLLLLVVYLALSATQDPGGYLSTDTGAKVATLDHMVDTGTWSPALPYWAEGEDPSGRVHPIYDTDLVDGEWVHVTTLPMFLAARPLYELGGYRAALLLPMLGGVAVAVAARSLARQVADEAAGWRAFWIAGLASPIVVYALDLWEHAPGVAAVVGAVALLARVVAGPRVVAPAFGAGALLGVAATMRTEALAYTAVAVGVCGCFLLLEGKVRASALTGVAALAGFAPVWAANRALELAVGGGSRAARASGAASNGLGDAGDRLREAVITSIAPRPQTFSTMATFGGVFVLVTAAAVLLARSDRPERGRLLMVLAGVLHLVLILDGLGFVPGMLVAAPIALLGVLSRPGSRPGAYVLTVALAALPLVWGFQFLGGALPQWAGRYLLPSCLLLVVLGAVALPSLDRAARVGLVAIAVLVSGSGVAWLGHRSGEVDRWFAQAEDRSEDVLIARNGFFVREGGAASAERRWLTAVSDDDLRFAVGVVERSGLRTFGVVDDRPEGRARLGDARLVGTERTDLLGGALYVHSYRL